MTKNQIKNITNQIVEKYNPERVILFGSYAKGTFNDNSDLDFIIVKEKRQICQNISEELN